MRNSSPGMKLRRRAIPGILPLLVLMTAGAAPVRAEQPPLPKTANAVIHFDLERLRQSKLYMPMEEAIGPFARSNEQLQMFLQATGLAEATAKTKGFTIYSFSDPQHPQDFAGVLTSAFGEETRGRLEQAYAPVARNVGGRIIMPVIQTPETEVVMSFLGPERLTFGTARAVELVVSEKDAAGMLAAYQRTATRRPIWGIINAREVISTLMAEMDASGGDNPMSVVRNNPALRSLTAVGFSLDLGKDVFFELRAFTDTADNARLLADAIKGAVALGQMGISQTDDADAVEFFRGVIAESERDSVYVSFTVTEAQIERLKKGDALLRGLIPAP